MTFPLEPKSTSRLEPGQFWALPLSNGTYGAAVVVSHGSKEDGTRHSRLFIAGLLDWNGQSMPDAGELQGMPVVKMGVAHVRAIQRTGGALLGMTRLRPHPSITTNVFRFMPVWGYGYAEAMAERHFVFGLPWEDDLTSPTEQPQITVSTQA